MPTNTTANSIGDAVTITTVVRTTAGVKTNSAMTLTVQSPTTDVKYGPITSTSSTVLDNTTVGTWRKTIILSRAGRWPYQWDSTGAVITSTGGALVVRPRFASTR